MKPLETLFEASGLLAYDLPEHLAQLYGGRVGFPAKRLYANFVSSLDGVVALEDSSSASAGSVISGHSEADRFVMGLLRACSDAVLVGAGTLRAEPKHRWTAEYVYPAAASEYAELRHRLGRSDQPQLVVVTSSGELDVRQPALQKDALILTTRSGATRLEGRVSEGSRVQPLGEEETLDPQRVVEAIQAQGHQVVLCEGGPHLMGDLLAAGGLVDELFLTVSPVVAGRGQRHRMGLAEGSELLPLRPRWGKLLSLRRHESYLFVRYDIS